MNRISPLRRPRDSVNFRVNLNASIAPRSACRAWFGELNRPLQHLDFGTELILPVRQLILEHVTTQVASLVGAKVPILNLQFGQGRKIACGKTLIDCCQLSGKNVKKSGPVNDAREFPYWRLSLAMTKEHRRC